MWILSFWLLILFRLLLHPKENMGCLTVYALVTFILLAPNFLGKTSMSVLATSLFVVGLLICAINIVEATRKRTALPFIGGVLLFLGIVSFPSDLFGGERLYFYYAQKYVYLFVLSDVSISGFILSVFLAVGRFVKRFRRFSA